MVQSQSNCTCLAIRGLSWCLAADAKTQSFFHMSHCLSRCTGIYKIWVHIYIYICIYTGTYWLSSWVWGDFRFFASCFHMEKMMTRKKQASQRCVMLKQKLPRIWCSSANLQHIMLSTNVIVDHVYLCNHTVHLNWHHPKELGPETHLYCSRLSD